MSIETKHTIVLPSEKQVAWAADIRIRFVEYFDKNKDALPDTASHCVET